MKKYISGILLGAMFFALAPQAFAITAEEVQTQIASVKSQIETLQTKLAELQRQLSGTNLANPSARALEVASPMASFNRTLRVGVKGEDVKAIQAVLISKGYLSDIADGSFGPKTGEAVKAYQRANNLTDDGVLGTRTLAIMKNLLTSNTSGFTPSNAKMGCSPTDAPSITITSPNGGEVYLAGQQVTVTWTSCNVVAGSLVSLGLYPSGTTGVALATDTANDGQETVTFPSTSQMSTWGWNYGKFYEVSIMVGKTGINDKSDSLFTITTKTLPPISTTQICGRTPSITVTSPNGGEVYTAGQQVNVTWKSCNFVGNVVIDLQIVAGPLAGNGMQLAPALLGGTPNDGQELVTLPTTSSWTNLTYGTYFKIHITDVSHTSLDWSDNLFTINAPVQDPGCAGTVYSTTTGVMCPGFWYRMSSNYSNQTVTAPATSYKIAEYTLYNNTTEPIRVTDWKVGVNAKSPLTLGDLTNLEFRTTANTPNSVFLQPPQATNTFSTNFVMAPGTQQKVEFFVTIGSVSGGSIQLNLEATGTGTSSGIAYPQYSNATWTPAAGQIITIGSTTQTGDLLCVKNSALSNQMILSNTTHARIGSYVCTNSTSESVLVKTMNVQITQGGTHVPLSDLSNLYIKSNLVTSVPLLSVSSVNSIPVNFNLPSGASDTFDVYADVGSASGNIQTAFYISGTGTQSGIAYPVSTTPVWAIGQLMTKGTSTACVPGSSTGKIVPSLNSATPSAMNVSLGSKNVEITRFNLANTGLENVCLNGIHLGSSSNVNNFMTNVKVIDVATGLQVGSVVSSFKYNGSYYYEWVYPSSTIQLAPGVTKVFKMVADFRSTVPLRLPISFTAGLWGLNFDVPGASAWGMPINGNTITVK